MAGKNRHKHKHKNKYGGKSFLILPIIFCFGILLITGASAFLNLGSVGSALGIVFSSAPKDYSTAYKNIYVPLGENETGETVTNAKGGTEIKSDTVEYPTYGTCFGKISIPDGIYYGSFIPGYGGTILVAGHNNTFFNGLKNAKAGQEITLKTGYGDYKYKIRETAVRDSLDTTAYDLSADYENLVLYTCYPFDEVGLTDKRLFVYADFTDGIPIEKN